MDYFLKNFMATLTIRNVPEEVIKSIWKSISYDELGKNALTRKRKRLTVNWFTEEFERQVLKNEKDPTIRLQKMIDDPENTSYWPFTPEEFIAEMKKW